MKSWRSLLVSIVVCLAAGGIGTIATADKITGWYATLAKPAWNPPNWIFGPVWTTLYILMAVSAWLIWERRNLPNARRALAVFGLQLILNTLWTFLFFGWEAPGPSLLEMALLWASIVTTIALFRPLSRGAALLLAPYIAWVSFAASLNYEIWRLNP